MHRFIVLWNVVHIYPVDDFFFNTLRHSSVQYLHGGGIRITDGSELPGTGIDMSGQRGADARQRMKTKSSGGATREVGNILFVKTRFDTVDANKIEFVVNVLLRTSTSFRTISTLMMWQAFVLQ